MTEQIKNAVLRALEARLSQCKLEMELCNRASLRSPGAAVFGDTMREQFAYWAGEMEIAITAHLAMQKEAVNA
jgi:hypothetical protein